MTKFIAEYIWIDGENNLRSKARTLNKLTYYDNINKLDSLDFFYNEAIIPNWNYDGSSTKQANGSDSEIILIPCYAVKCPFRKGQNILVMCETYKSNMTVATNNNRKWAKTIFYKNFEEKPWFGIEQEFFMINPETNKPVGWNEKVNKQGQYYCSVGTQNAFSRELIDKHYEYCLYAGLNISGINAEVAPGQWEYQIGPVEGIDAGDQLWLSRYIIQRIAEQYKIIIDFEPKPLDGNWNGSGCHTNYSTLTMRQGSKGKDGIEFIKEAVNKLSLKHNEHMKVYGTGNELRMTGLHETSSFEKFSWGIADRSASIRIPRDTENDKCGYFEDRRPSSNMDPYLVTAMLFNSTVIE